MAQVEAAIVIHLRSLYYSGDPLSIFPLSLLSHRDLVIELTGEDRVMDRVHRHVPEGVRVIDHIMARIFWDLEKVETDLRQELRIRTELQAKMARDRAQLQDILNAVPDLVIVLDRDARVVRVNQRFEHVTGRPRDWMLGRPIQEAFEATGAAAWRKSVKTHPRCGSG